MPRLIGTWLVHLGICTYQCCFGHAPALFARHFRSLRNLIRIFAEPDAARKQNASQKNKSQPDYTTTMPRPLPKEIRAQLEARRAAAASSFDEDVSGDEEVVDAELVARAGKSKQSTMSKSRCC